MVQVQRLIVVTGVLAFAACGGRSDVPSIAPSDPVAAIRAFMNAVEANNVTEMGMLWGTDEGSAARKMDQEEMMQRLIVMRTYLQHESYEVLPSSTSAMPEDARHRNYGVRISNHGCTHDVPFRVVRAEEGWLVQAVDIGVIGNPRRMCPS